MSRLKDIAALALAVGMALGSLYVYGLIQQDRAFHAWVMQQLAPRAPAGQNPAK